MLAIILDHIIDVASLWPSNLLLLENGDAEDPLWPLCRLGGLDWWYQIVVLELLSLRVRLLHRNWLRICFV